MSCSSQIGERLKEERQRLGLPQREMAQLSGVSREMWAKYEAGAEPGAAALARLAAHGVDVLYVLTGTRAGATPRGAHAPSPDLALLRECVGAIEAALDARGIRLVAENRTRLYWGVYELSLPGGKLNPAVVEPLLNVLSPSG